MLPLEPTVVNNAVLGAAFPIGVLCRPPSKSPGPVALNEPVRVILLPLTLPVTPTVLPKVAVPLTVNALTVVFPVVPNVVKLPDAGVALPIGVLWIPLGSLISTFSAAGAPVLVTNETVLPVVFCI